MFFRQFLAKKNQEYPANQIAITNVTLPEYAALCRDVNYPTNDPLRPPLPLGWSRILDSGPITTGYFGALYVKHEDQPTEAMFVHRAELPTQAKNLTNNIKLAFKKIPNLYLSAEIFLGRALDFLIRTYGENNLNHVNFSSAGHAFGGVLAEICSAYFIPVISFENPGSKDALINIYRYELKNFTNSEAETEKLIKSGLQLMRKNCMNYCVDINAINTAEEQAGNTFLLKPSHYNYEYNNQQPIGLENVSLQASLNPYYLNSYSLHQHSLTEIYDRFNNPITLKYIKLPVGLQNGYKAYLDYETRKDYWDGYAEHYWQQQDKIRQDYADNFPKFKTDFLQQLTLLKQTVEIPQEKLSVSDEDNLSLLIGGFSLFTHPDYKPNRVEEKQQTPSETKENNLADDFQIINKDNEKKERSHRSNCSIM